MQLTDNQKKWSIIAVAILMFLCVLFFLYRGRGAQVPTPTPAGDTQRSLGVFTTPTPDNTGNTPTGPESEIWIFERFTGEVRKSNGWEYEYAIFANKTSPGTKIRAWCSAPNSPEPKVGAEYRWDKTTNILVPVVDNSRGNLQRFWEPEYVR